MRTIIAGSRSIADLEHVRDALRACSWNVTEIVSGGARGVDTLGELLAEECNVPVERFYVTSEDWNHYGKGAGFRRNQEMADYADALILVWDGKSSGSADMLKRAKRKFPDRILEWDITKPHPVMLF